MSIKLKYTQDPKNNGSSLKIKKEKFNNKLKNRQELQTNNSVLIKNLTRTTNSEIITNLVTKIKILLLNTNLFQRRENENYNMISIYL